MTAHLISFFIDGIQIALLIAIWARLP